MSVAQHLSTYWRNGIVQIESTYSDQLPSGQSIRLLADKVCDIHTPTAVMTNENIFFTKNGSDTVEIRKVETRIENFVSTNQHWMKLCNTGGILSTLVGLVCVGEGNDDNSPWCLYKEKLNIKPAGSTGFAPHLDSPSLRVTGLCDTFVTVMIAIDDMTIENGCLQVCRGDWNEANSVLCEQPDTSAERGEPRWKRTSWCHN